MRGKPDDSMATRAVSTEMSNDGEEDLCTGMESMNLKKKDEEDLCTGMVEQTLSKFETSHFYDSVKSLDETVNETGFKGNMGKTTVMSKH